MRRQRSTLVLLNSMLQNINALVSTMKVRDNYGRTVLNDSLLEGITDSSNRFRVP